MTSILPFAIWTSMTGLAAQAGHIQATFAASCGRGISTRRRTDTLNSRVAWLLGEPKCRDTGTAAAVPPVTLPSETTNR